ncbi:SGNH/GDSL hydrolase family protein [Persicitalea sp.]|uniref:SGNH/GDSL hydrolase family protein n=1 Tax=Persicitalea sp. TaxID=3100273 RepID=UPI003593AD3F
MRKTTITFLAFGIALSAWRSALPTIFLIGDSISIQYGPHLKEYLAGSVTFERKMDDGQAEKNLDVPVGANGGDSRMVLAYLKRKIQEPAFHPDYLVLNCGLHDIKRDPKTGVIQVTADEYRNNLLSISELMKSKNIAMIWIRTTPVVDSIHNTRSKSIRRYASDLAAYNAIADLICERNNIPTIDLFRFTEKLGKEQFIDHVHYNEPTRTLQAAFLAGSIQSYLAVENSKPKR